MAKFTEPKDGEPIDAKALEQQLFETERAAYDAPTPAVLVEVQRALHRYQWTAERLSEAAQGIHCAIEELLQYLSKYGLPSNSLGVLQSQGPDLDRLCGELTCRHEALTRIIRVANAMLTD
jgi:hypothetical protein